MPAIALVAAVGTISAGAALGGVLGGVMLAGGVMSGLGAVTGNKELSKWGAVASLGAGLGSAMGLAGAANSGWNSLVGAGADGAGSALGVTGNSFLANGGSMSGIGDAIGYKGPAPASGAIGAGDVGKTAGLPASDCYPQESGSKCRRGRWLRGYAEGARRQPRLSDRQYCAIHAWDYRRWRGGRKVCQIHCW